MLHLQVPQTATGGVDGLSLGCQHLSWALLLSVRSSNKFDQNHGLERIVSQFSWDPKFIYFATLNKSMDKAWRLYLEPILETMHVEFRHVHSEMPIHPSIHPELGSPAHAHRGCLALGSAATIDQCHSEDSKKSPAKKLPRVMFTMF